MNIKKLGLGLGAFAAGAAAWTWGASRFGDKVVKALDLDDTRGDGQLAAASGAGIGAVPGDSTTSLVTPRPATMAAAPVGMAETEKDLPASRTNRAAEHVPTDLIGDERVTIATRAPEAFRPDPTAVPTEAEREALRPATGPAPTLAADRGSGFSEAAGAA